MKRIERRRIEKSKRRLRRRLDGPARPTSGKPVIGGGNIRYEVAAKTKATVHGGIGTFMQLIRAVGLAEAIDRRLHLLKLHLPYRESDHVLNLALNALCEGTCLDDIETRRQDEVFLDAIGAERIPDPTTAGDFLRRFDDNAVLELMAAFDDARVRVWRRQPADFFAEAVLEADGTMVATTGQCKQGMDINYKGLWGYHPLVITLANTGELLRLYNRPGNRPSHEGADAFLDEAIALVRQAGFRRVTLRGDTDFTQSHKLDEWNAIAGLTFLFGVDSMRNLVALAEELPPAAWRPLERRVQRQRRGPRRARPANVKERIVVQRQYENLKLAGEDIAQFDYQPGQCAHPYRLVVLRKNLSRLKGEAVLLDEIRYFFYITNDRQATAAQIVLSANDRCQQENLIAQLKSGVCALKAPVNTQTANWAYMVCTALAWNLKAWWALWLPEGTGRWARRHAAEKRAVVGMEFKRFAQAFIRIPCQIVQAGRQLVYRILNWNPWQHLFYRNARALRC